MRHTSSLILALALAGCATIPQLDEPVAMRDPAILAANGLTTAPEGAFPSDRWWAMLGDDQLDQLVGEALRDSPDLAAARARARGAAAFQDQARAATLPSLGLEASAGGTRISQNQGFPPGLIPGDVLSQGRIAAVADFDLDLWGRKRAALTAATSAARAAEVDTAQSRLLLVSAIASTYLDLDALFQRRDLARAALENAEREAALAQARQRRGLDNAGAVSQVEGQAARAKGDLAAIDEAIALNRNALAALVGAGPERATTIDRPQLAAAHGLALPANLPLDLAGRRPDIVSARLRAESAAARIGVARAAFYPDINLTALIGLQAIGLDNLFSDSSLIGNAGSALRLPLFDGGAARAGYRAARADYDEAVSTYNATVIAAIRQIADAVATKRSLAEQISSATSGVTAAEAQLAVARQRYEAGIADARALLAAERAMIGARATLAALHSRDHQADIALATALGGGFADTTSRNSKAIR